ncbi:hypothetical protein HK107_11230 [Parvularcula sp. ZS-1/3]|uniref:DUF642 domain-containing protein n=1 Tax=Parvularcula mediterranea TaxID=2732508 RepID=A0A7Y3RNJ2_9PROT|nr:hypothetical protein [Parvularcula mediterranea]NNU16890.1 hypothetical protein [Parvularcula mediterranea]
MTSKMIAAALAGAALMTASADAAVVFTEGFEGQQISSRWRVFDNFGQFMTIDGAGIEIQRSGTVVTAYEGNQYVELDSHKGNGGDVNAATSNTSMAALANLVAGAQHSVTFAYRPRTNNYNDNGIAVSIGNLDTSGAEPVFTQSMQIGSVDGRRRDQNAWHVVTMNFLAGVGDNAIMFRAFGSDNTLGGFLDDIAIEADLTDVNVPLPGAAFLLGTGIALMARSRRRV